MLTNASYFAFTATPLLSRVSVGAKTMTQVVDGLAIQPSSTFTMVRIERDREAALRKYKQDRDTTALERTIKHLDDEEREARAATEVISPAEAVAWLQDLPALWAAADDSGTRLLTEALFKKVEVLGPLQVWVQPSEEAEAQGWASAMHGEFEREVRRYVGARGLAPTLSRYP